MKNSGKNKIYISSLIKKFNDRNIFSDAIIKQVEDNIYQKDNEKHYLTCLIRNKEIQVKSEEIIRQLMIAKLISPDEYGYDKSLLKVEHPISMGSDNKKSADIVVLNKGNKNSVYIIIEVKKLKSQDGREQMKSYTHASGAPLAVWTNGESIEYFERVDPNKIASLSDIPKASQTVEEIKDDSCTYLDLMKNDKLSYRKMPLKKFIKDMEDEVLANAGVDIFEEVFKLIFIKLYDEMQSKDDRQEIERQLKVIERKIKQEQGEKGNDVGEKEAENPENIGGGTESITNQQYYQKLLKRVDEAEASDKFRQLEFRCFADEERTKANINKLFNKAKDKWKGIFDEVDKIRIDSAGHLAVCISYLQDVKLFNSNLQVIDEAFEYLINKSAKGEKGQYFTPRNVIDMAVYMINPQPHEYMIDTACGSCGFTVHTLFNVWEKLKNGGKAYFSNFSNQTLNEDQKDYVEKVFGIDFDEKAVRVSKTLNVIAGDGETNVLHLNSLDYENWQERKDDREWSKKYQAGYHRLLDKSKHKSRSGETNDLETKEFNFDIVLANPPFAGDVREPRITTNYDIVTRGRSGKSFNKNKASRDVLFIERNLDFLKAGGRMAIVLPQGRFNNSSDEQVREFITERARLIAVVGLDVNAFKPHTGTKTSVLFVQKWDEDENSSTYNPKPKTKEEEDYEVFMAVSEVSGKNNSGLEVYEVDKDGERVLDEHGHLIQKHDLKQIADEFAIWAKNQKLSFWKDDE